MANSVDIRELNEQIEAQTGFVTDLETGMSKVIVGQKYLIRSLLVGLLSNGHVLLEGAPGLAKTLAIKTLAKLIEGNFSRIQFTPDLLPSDVIGTLIYSQREERFETKKGPVFANFVLADEINRAPAKVQSALLEAMQEHQVTIGETSYSLPDPFLVLATQNPIEQEGTYELPEAQVDRFMLKALVDYPTLEEEKTIVRSHLRERIEQYVANIVMATRNPENYGLADLKKYINFGGSPRASINLALAARTTAFLKRRGYVVPEDVREIVHDVLRHRIGLTYEAEAEEMTADGIIKAIIDKVEVP